MLLHLHSLKQSSVQVSKLILRTNTTLEKSSFTASDESILVNGAETALNDPTTMSKSWSKW